MSSNTGHQKRKDEKNVASFPENTEKSSLIKYVLLIWYVFIFTFKSNIWSFLKHIFGYL